MMLIRIFKSERGHLETLLLMILFGVSVGLLLPFLVAKIFPGSDIRHSAGCIENLLRIKHGAGPGSLECPASGLPYKIVEKDGTQTVACPDPDKHLGFPLRLVREGGAWRLQNGLPAIVRPAKALESIAGASPETALRLDGERTILKLRYRLSLRIMVLIGLGLLGLILLVAGIALAYEFFQVLADLLRRKKEDVAPTVFLGLFAAVLLVGSAASWRGFVYAAFSHEEVSFRSGRPPLSQTFLYGEPWGEPESYDGYETVLPLIGEYEYRAALFYMEDGEPSYKRLFSRKGLDLSPVAFIDETAGPRTAAGTERAR